MKTIIALRGDANTGKSTTIGMIYEELVDKGYNIIQERRTYRNKPSHDFIAILKFNKIKIGITTYGDVPKVITAKIKVLVKAKCEVIICACHKTERGYGDYNHSITQFKDYKHMFFGKTINNVASTQNKTNQEQAKEIIEIVEILVK